MEAGKLLSGLLVALSVASAGCVSGLTDEGVDAENVDQSVENAMAGVDTDVLEGLIQLSAATPAVTLNNGGDYAFPLTRASNDTGYVLELEWDATTPASENLDVWVRLASAGNVPPEDPTALPPPEPVAKATGPSGLRVSLAAGDLPDDAEYEILVRAPSDMGAGATVDQAFTLHVTTFTDTPFDAEYTALDGDG